MATIISRTSNFGRTWYRRTQSAGQAGHAGSVQRRGHRCRTLSQRQNGLSAEARRRLVLAAFALVACALIGRGIQFQFIRDFLQNQGDARSLRTERILAHRGMILDRNDEPLAVSTPTSSIYAVPDQLAGYPDKVDRVAKILGVAREKIAGRLAPRRDTGRRRDFAYLKRHVAPEIARQVMELEVPGVYIQREYRRFYPALGVAAHVVGFTNIDDRGQEGIELVFNDSLRGKDGEKRVLKDRLGRTVENVESVQPVQPGQDLRLSLDKRLQFETYRELAAAVNHHAAKSGSAVLMNARTGEILAMVNQPDFNPNNRKGAKPDQFRNRAITDAFEPGSTMKPFIAAAALESGTVRPSTPIDTRPGFYTVGRHTIRDDENFGLLNVTGVISKSSNVGISKIALGLSSSSMWTMLSRVGFGELSATGLPGESAGRLPEFDTWKEFQQATISFGYGVSVSAVQLARAYTVFANEGILVPATILRNEHPAEGTRVMSVRTARQIKSMLEEVVSSGTGKAAALYNYRVGGKTGTAHKAMHGSYAENSYRSLFVGMLTASKTPLVAAVMIDDPHNGKYFGGDVAAPVFSRIMQHAVRLLDIPPDMDVETKVPHVPTNVVAKNARVFAEKFNQ